MSDRSASARYHDLAINKGSGTPYDDLVPVPDARIAALRQEYPGLPADFTDFLTEIGAGSFAGDRYQLYDGLVPAGELYATDAAVMVFGDDLQGFCNGFGLQGGQVVELDPTDGGVRPVAASFEAFVRATIAELA